MSHNSLQRIAIDYASSSGEDDVVYPITDSDTEQYNRNKIVRRRSKRSHNPKSSKRVENTTKRIKGQEYMRFSMTGGSYKQNSPKARRDIGRTCSSAFCIKSNIRHCQEFDEKTRKKIFNMFWGQSWESKSVFVKNQISQMPVKRQRIENSKKQHSFLYKLPYNHGSLQVCRSMFLSTLSIKKGMVGNWLKSNDKPKDNESPAQNLSTFSSKITDRKIHLEEYFQKLDKMESHYCRKDTNKIYIAAAFNTKADIYRDYVTYCSEKQVPYVSIFTFSTYFEEQNYSLFMPRKDQCDICVSFNAKQITAEQYNDHVLKKQRAQEEKLHDKLAAQEGKCHVFTMDMQAVKLCPNINASAIYFKQRLQVHNFTVYNLATYQCTNYWWNETQGDLSASTFVSIIIYDLKTHCSTDNLPIKIYSDGCGYQNRNQFLSNALSNFAIDNNKIIEQKYLENGHTQMECDTAHAKIETKLKKQSIYLPIDYIRITLESRKTVKINDTIIRKPFEAMYLNYDFFKNYNDAKLIRFSSIRPGRTKNDPTVSHLGSLKYSPNGDVEFKVNFNEEYKNLPIRIKKYTGYTEPEPLHTGQLPIQPKI